MLGLLISFIFVFVSSYFITSIFTPKEGKYRCCGFLILLCTAFAQIVLSFEILSLFKAINSINVLITNLLFFIVALIFWIKNEKPLYFPNIPNALKKIWFALKKDKFLMIMSLGLVFFILVSIFLCIVSPIKNYDAMSYHLNRSAFWLFQGNLNHFDIADERNLVMPINSEILYLWVLTFLKNDIGLGLFSFLGYLSSAYSVYNILGYFNFSEPRKLWSVFILSSFASVIVEASSSETDVLIAGLILSSIYLFLVALREQKLSLIFFSSLFYALAAGTKSPAIIAFPGIFCCISYFAYRRYKKESLKPILAFCGFLFLNFMIFSSYNYILNFIDYQDFLGSESSKVIHCFRGGIKGFVANFIRYMFMLFDFSGFRYSEYIGNNIVNARLALFNFLNIPADIGVIISDDNVINNTLAETKTGTGLFGFLLFLPSLIATIILKFWKIINKKDSEKLSVMFMFAVMFFINIICLSFSIGYFVFSIRFVTTMVLISSPVLALSYMRKNYLIKTLILFFVMSYFIVMSQNINARSVKELLNVYAQEPTIEAARERIQCAVRKGYLGKCSFCHMRDFIKTNISPDKKIGIINKYNSRMYVIKMMEKDGYKFDIILPEKIDSYDIEKYDYIIMTDDDAISMVLQGKTKDIMKRIEFDEDGNILLPERSDEVRCLYYDNNSQMAINKNRPNQVIYAVHCVIPTPFWNKHGFERVSRFEFVAQHEQEKNIMTVYKNKNHKIDSTF